MTKTIQVLDCTLRDGGQGLENRNNNGIKTQSFSEQEKYQIVELLGNSGIDIIEIGSMSNSAIGQEHYAIYENIESLSRFLPKSQNSKQLFTGLFIDPDTPLDDVPNYSPELVEGIRVIMRYSQMQRSIDFCAGLAKKGYKVFIQPMLTMRYTDDELERLIYAANEMNAYSLYIVDSFGYMFPENLERLYRFYSEKLNSNIRIGFHAHNNMDSAFHNVSYFINQLADRDCIIDACATGMGQGAGNMQLEILVHYLNQRYGTKYDLDCVLAVCDKLEKFRQFELESWGYSPIQFVPAIHGASYKYAIAMRVEYDMSLVDIHHALSKLNGDMRHRYTPDHLKKLLQL